MSDPNRKKPRKPRLSKRRARVVPIVTPRQRRRWQRARSTDISARLHLWYLEHREEYLPRYFSTRGRYYPEPGLSRAWRWYAGDVTIQAWRLLRDNGRFVRETAGLPRYRQFVDLLRLSIGLPSMPENYYKFEWYRPENRARVNDYLHRHETKGVLYRMLTDTPGLDTVAPLTDKTRFVQKALEAGLPVAPVVARFENGVATHSEPLPRHDLFVKPEGGRGGRGTGAWVYDEATDRYHRVDKTKSMDREQLAGFLAERSRHNVYIVQPRLVSHPDLRDIALDAVPTCRLVTLINEHGEVEPVIAVLRMPAVRGKVVDNIHAGGIAAPVDLATGEVGAATGLGLTPSPRYRRHPVTDGQIEGRRLPYWDDIVKLAVDAHRHFTPRIIVGWDISIGPDGPVLVEGNSQPCVDLLQRPHDLPLGTHRFGELLAHHIGKHFGTDSDGAATRQRRVRIPRARRPQESRPLSADSAQTHCHPA